MYAAALVALGLLSGSLAQQHQYEKRWEDLPVLKRDDFEARSTTLQRRIEKHEATLDYYRHNLDDVDFMAKQAEIMAAAHSLEGGPAQRKRGSVDGDQAPMLDYFDGSVDISYLVNISIGTPLQTFQVVPDTGSADLWVISSQVSDPGHDLFNVQASSTINITQYTFVDIYGLGSANGTIVQDTVAFVNYTIPQKYFGVATSIDSQFRQQANDGIIGMASSSISAQGVVTFFERLIALKMINNPYFSVYLTRGLDTTTTPGYVSGSTICIGCLPVTPSGIQTSGNMNYIPVSTFAYWQVTLGSITNNNQNISGTSTQVIIDTGTTAIYLPTTVADAMMATISGKRQSDGSYYVPASALTSNPQFGFTFSGYTYTVNLLDLIDGYVDRAGTTLSMLVYAADTQDPNGRPLGILGDAFIKNVLTVYSYSTNGSPAVGMQQLVSGGSSTAFPSSAVVSSTRRPGVPTTGTLGATNTKSLGAGGTSSAAASGSGTAKSSGRETAGNVRYGLVGTALGMCLAVLAGAAFV